jgi:uncharacterized protein YutD
MLFLVNFTGNKKKKKWKSLNFSLTHDDIYIYCMYVCTEIFLGKARYHVDSFNYTNKKKIEEFSSEINFWR